MEEINLLQNRLKDTTFAWQKQSRIATLILTVILIALIGAAAVFFLLNRNFKTKITSAIAESETLKNQVDDKQKNLNEAKTFQAQLINLKALVANHTYLSPFLDELSHSTYVKARYFSLDITEAGKIHLEGQVASYGDLAKFLLGLSTSSRFKNVNLLSVIPSSGKDIGYRFSVDLVVVPEIFHKK